MRVCAILQPCASVPHCEGRSPESCRTAIVLTAIRYRADPTVIPRTTRTQTGPIRDPAGISIRLRSIVISPAGHLAPVRRLARPPADAGRPRRAARPRVWNAYAGHGHNNNGSRLSLGPRGSRLGNTSLRTLKPALAKRRQRHVTAPRCVRRPHRIVRHRGPTIGRPHRDGVRQRAERRIGIRIRSETIRSTTTSPRQCRQPPRDARGPAGRRSACGHPPTCRGRLCRRSCRGRTSRTIRRR